MFQALLSQLSREQSQTVDGVVTAFVVAVIAILALGGLWIQRERNERLAAQRRAFDAERALLASGNSNGGEEAKLAERNDLMFEQHRRMNQLTIAKLETEIQLMQAQLTQRETTEDRLEAGKEYHELMVEKTKLEMDSLRLHIAELRKRMEDWNSD
jgi:Tfp pilus assembly protein PilV